MHRKPEDSEGSFKDISIPMSLFKKIEKRIERTEFKKVSDYIVYVLNEVLEENEGEVETTTKKDEQKVKERLKALGYIE